jgi:hypothetical protein
MDATAVAPRLSRHRAAGDEPCPIALAEARSQLCRTGYCGAPFF